MLDRRVKSLAERILPRSLWRKLDPVQASIDDEAETLGRRVGTTGFVLDAGAGEGRHRGCFAPGTYISIDRGTGDPAWDYSGIDIRGDLEHLPLRSAAVNHILCMVVLEHTRRPRQVIEEFDRVLRPGGTLRMVVPFLWEEHQAPHDYFRFTRFGISSLFEGLGMELERVDPMGGFFSVCARRSVALLEFFQSGWRWLPFVLLAPVFGVLIPLLLHRLDFLDRERHYTLAFLVHARKPPGDCE